MEPAGRWLAVGGWRLAVGGWRLAVGGSSGLSLSKKELGFLGGGAGVPRALARGIESG